MYLERDWRLDGLKKDVFYLPACFLREYSHGPATVIKKMLCYQYGKTKMSNKQILEDLFKELNAPEGCPGINNETRLIAAKRLYNEGPEAIPYLATALSGPGGAYATVALKKIGKKAIPECLKALSSPGAPYAQLFFSELGENCIEELIVQLGIEKAAVYAALSLKDIGKPAIKPLICALTNHNHSVRMYAALVLRDMGPMAVAAVSALESALNDSNINVSEAAKQALGRIRLK